MNMLRERLLLMLDWKRSSAAWCLLAIILIDNTLWGQPYKAFAGFVLLEAALAEKVALPAVCAVFLVLAYYWLVFAQSRGGGGRMLAWLAFVLAGVHEYGYRVTLGRYSTADDILLTLRFSNTSHWLDAAQKYASPMALIPGLALGYWLCVAPRTKRTRFFLLGLVLATASCCVLAALASRSWTKRFGLFPTPAPLAAARSTTEFVLGEIFWPTPRREPLKWATSNRPTNNIVLVVAESMSGDALSINGNPRATTPVLEVLQGTGHLRNWGIAAAGATCSHATGMLLVSGVPSTLLPDRARRVETWPSIFQYAKAAGYRTSFLDGQMDSFWLGVQDRANIDYWVPHRELADAQRPWATDSRLATEIRALTQRGTGNFIMVWLSGVHTPYIHRYPREGRLWTPVPESWNYNWFQDPNEAELIQNAYDNAVHYSVESFFSFYLSETGAPPDSTVLFYTGDHGQTLARNGETHTHCGGTRNEALVPLFAVGEQVLSWQKDPAVPASHENIFASLLDLMQVPPSARPHAYAPSLLDPLRVGRPRLTLGGGSLRDPDHKILIDPQ